MRFFFDKIVHNFQINLKDINIVAVLHIVPGILSFVDALRKLAKKLVIIPKPNSISNEILSQIPKNLLYRTTRNELKDIKVLNKIFKKEEKYCIIDIGGYFANKEFMKFNKKRKMVIGIVEDTENGYQRYERLENDICVPVISVARSELKNNEDDLVGYSIGFYTEWVIRKLRSMPRYMSCSIIGYGKLGKGIAKYLFNQNIKPLIYDTDPIKVIEAIKDGCVPASKEEILYNSELIFCATGNISLNISDFLKIRPGCYIASVTSSDDEFDLNDINKYFQKTVENKFIIKYENENTYFYLINNGNTVNFIDREGDSVSDFIRIIQAEILCALRKLTKDKIKIGIHETTKEEKRKIASIFLNYYRFNFNKS
jgi:adenosylhomocysteinase